MHSQKSSIDQSFIDSVKKSLSQKHLIANNDLKTLQLPPDESNEDQLLVLFYWVLNNTYKTQNGQYISFINEDMVLFEQEILYHFVIPIIIILLEVFLGYFSRQ